MDSRLTKRYGELEQWHWWFRGRQRVLETVLANELGRATDLVVVSLGCGPPDGLTWLLRWAGGRGRVVGVDAEGYQGRTATGSIIYTVGDVQAVPLVSGSFDVVLALDVLEHLDDDTAGLRESFRLLKPGGLLVVTVPAMPSLWGGQDVVSHHRRRYTRASLYRAFVRSQLPRPRLTFFNTLLFPIIAGVRWTRLGLGFSARNRSDFDDNDPGLINELLAGVFAAERYLVGKVPMPFGVSLLAVAHR